MTHWGQAPLALSSYANGGQTKHGDRRNVFRFCPAVTPPPAGSAPVPGTVPSSLVAPPGAPRADVPTQFPDASRSSRNLAGGRCGCYAELRRFVFFTFARRSE